MTNIEKENQEIVNRMAAYVNIDAPEKALKKEPNLAITDSNTTNESMVEKLVRLAGYSHLLQKVQETKDKLKDVFVDEYDPVNVLRQAIKDHGGVAA